MRSIPTERRAAMFWAKVDRRSADECWPWLGQINDAGYGLVTWSYRIVRAHRKAFELTYGSVSEELVLDHICHGRDCLLATECPHRRCCNPAHLVETTRAENAMRGGSPFAVNALKTHCPKGHEYTGENLRIRRGQREWRACGRERVAAQVAAQRSK